MWWYLERREVQPAWQGEKYRLVPSIEQVGWG